MNKCYFLRQIQQEKKRKKNMLKNSAKFDKKNQCSEDICTTGKDLPNKMQMFTSMSNVCP